MTPVGHVDDTIGEALVLRSFARHVLGRVAPPPALRASAAACTPAAWELFVTAESCALPLLRRLQALALLDALPAVARTVVQRAAVAESQRTLAAATQLPGLDAIAVSLGVTPLLLKGAAHLAARGEPLDLGDVDVLVPADRADAFADAMQAAGYRPQFEGLGNDEDGIHLPGLVPPGGIPVEVHREARYGDDVLDETAEARPLAGHAALRHAAGPRTVVNVLHHAVVLHPHRFGHLRDVVLLATLVRALSSDDRQVVHDRLAAAPDGADLLTMLAQADAVDAGAPIPDPDACRLIAARKYALVSGEDATLGRRFAAMGILSYLGFERAPRGRTRIRSYLGGRVPPNCRWFSPRIARVSLRAANAAARVARTVPRLAIVAGALAMTPRALARARRRVRTADALLARGSA